MQQNIENSEYRGMRALLLTRVSTSEQEKMYGHTWQEMEIRKKLIVPLNLKLDEERHIIHDTYSGLEYRYREALERILEMAERAEFDVLCMEVLDRGLGRKALAREIFRMQLRELGVRILTTDPSDHADDDSLEGQIMRFIKGIKAEEEITDFVRRTMGGKHAKVEGIQKGGTQGLKKLIGCGPRLYGYTYTLSPKGKREMYVLNCEVVFVDENGGVWTEVAVVMFVFNAAEEGIPIRQIVNFLNQKGIPSPRGKGWNKTSISRMLHNTAYIGKEVAFATRGLAKKRGRKTAPRVKTSPEEQVIVPVPRIIEDEQFEAIQVSLVRNKKNATRNLQHPYKGLLRSGLAKCAQCNGNLVIQIRPGRYKGKQGIDADEIRYQCGNYTGTLSKCKGCSTDARMLDAAGWAEAVKIIRDPSEVDKRIQKLTADNPITKQHRNKLATLADIHNRQTALRKDLSEMSQKGKLDKGTREYLSSQLTILAKQEADTKQQLEDEQAVKEQYNKLQQRIVEFHKRCTQWREKLDDPQFTPSYKFMRDACEFFGITAIVYKAGHEQRYEIQKDPPSIVLLISSTTCQWP